MKKTLIALILILSYGLVNSQTTNTTNDAKVIAKFDGSPDLSNLQLYLLKQIPSPVSSGDNFYQAKMILKFQITSTGKIDSIDFINGLTPEAENEVFKSLMKSEPLWTPGSVRGKYVKSTFIIPLNYPISSKRLDFYINKGNKFYSKLEYQNALDNYIYAIRLDPFNSDILQKKIDCDKNLGNSNELQKDLKLMEHITKNPKKIKTGG